MTTTLHYLIYHIILCIICIESVVASNFSNLGEIFIPLRYIWVILVLFYPSYLNDYWIFSLPSFSSKKKGGPSSSKEITDFSHLSYFFSFTRVNFWPQKLRMWNWVTTLLHCGSIWSPILSIFFQLPYCSFGALQIEIVKNLRVLISKGRCILDVCTWDKRTLNEKIKISCEGNLL